MILATQRILEAALRAAPALAQRERFQCARGAEPDIGQPRLTVDRHAQHHVGPAPALGRTAANAPEQRRRAEADVVQGRPEQRVVLEAISAAAVIEKFPFEIDQREADGASALD